MSFFERPPVSIYLVRHGQSEANVNKNVYREKPDHAIPLTSLGLSQADEAGRFLANHLAAHANEAPAIIIRSPYQRARETEDRIANAVGDQYIAERVELTECAEQQYGLFDGVPPDELNETFPKEYQRYLLAQKNMGKFWACPPQGESLFRVYERATSVANMIRFGHRKGGINTFIIVAHGNWMRCFIMAWCNLPYEWIAKSRVPENCEVMKIQGPEIIGSVFLPSHTTHEAIHGPQTENTAQNGEQA